MFCADFVAAMTYDVHAHVATMDNPKVAQMHADAEVFDPRTEVSALLNYMSSVRQQSQCQTCFELCFHNT